jgi:matrixin
MARRQGRWRPAMAVVCAVTAAAIGAWSHRADAFELKHASHGERLHWAEPRVDYVIDPSVGRAVPGGTDAVSSAIGGWSGQAGGPTLSAAVGTGAAKPGLDGQNSVLLAPDGFAPAGGALAITVTSYDDASGAIVDADIVINGVYRFAVLAAGAHPTEDTPPISTDSTLGRDDVPQGIPFDLAHVVSHEVGHTLGLADERADHSALMYAFTMPGDASMRTPSSDDVDGVDALYGTSGASSGGSPSRSGCGQASVAGSRTRPADVWGALSLVAGAGVWLASRRRAKVMRMILPLGAALAALVGNPVLGRSAPRAAVLVAEASARVVGVSTSNAGGLFETTLDLVPTACQNGPCPERAQAHAWGGSLGGITQRIGGGEPVPSVGDVVDIAFPPSSAAAAYGNEHVLAAALVALRH